MKTRNVIVLTVLCGALAVVVLCAGLVLLALAVRGGARLFHKPVGTVLTYEIEQMPGEKPELVNMDRLIWAIDRRINPGTFPAAQVRAIGSDRIEVGVFGNDPATVRRIERLLDFIGTIEFRILATRQDANYDYGGLIDRALVLPEKEKVLTEAGRSLARWVPVQAGKEKQFEKNPNLGTRWVTRQGGEKHLEVLVVLDEWNVTGAHLTRATPGVDQNLRPAVNFSLSTSGAERFGALTGAHLPDPVGKYEYQLGIILDGKLQSAPSLRDAIFASGEITGDFTDEEVREYVDVLNAGALPAGIRRVQPLDNPPP